MRLLAPADAARRARAAIAYSGLEQDEVAASAGLHLSKVARIASRSKPRGATIEELWAIADACGVPRTFMETGFSASDEDPAARLDSVEELLEAVTVLLPAVLDLCGGAEKLPPGGVRALRRVLGTTTPADHRSRG